MDARKKLSFANYEIVIDDLPADPSNLLTAEEKEKYNIISIQYLPSIRREQCMTEHEKMNKYLNRNKGDPPSASSSK